MAVTTKVLEREERIVGFLKEKAEKGETVSKTALAKYAGVTPEYTGQIVRKLMKNHKEIQNISKPCTEAEYKWVEDAPVEKDELVEVMPGVLELAEPQVMTPTLTATQKTGKILPGEVWQTEESNGAKGMIFALNSLNGACQGIKLYPDSDETRTIVGENPFSVDILGRTYLGDPTHVTFKPLKYCIRRRMFTHVGKLNEAKEALMKVFGIEIPKPEVVKAKPEVKIVYRDRPEKKEEKPAIPDNYIDARSAYIAHLETERDIWKEVAMKLLDKNS